MPRRLLLLLLALLLSCMVGGGSSSAGAPGSMSVVTRSDVPVGSFVVTVEGVGPAGGYAAIQTSVILAGLTFAETQTPRSEVVWPECVHAARFYSGTVVMHGCVAKPIAPSSYAGPLVSFAVNCAFPGTYGLSLMAGGPFASYYMDANGVQHQPTLSGAAVVCHSACDWADLDQSGNVTVADIGKSVSAFGLVSPHDRDGDGVVTIADIFVVVAQFGGVC